MGINAVRPAERMTMEKPIVELILSIPIGTVIGWLVVIFSGLAGLCTVAIKVYKMFEKYKAIKDKNEELTKTVTKHEEAIAEVLEELKIINGKLDSQDESRMKELRYRLVKDGEKYLEPPKKITIRMYSAWMEGYDEYRNKYKQNAYVHSLKEKIEREAEIVGKLDAHGMDVE